MRAVKHTRAARHSSLPAPTPSRQACKCALLPQAKPSCIKQSKSLPVSPAHLAVLGRQRDTGANHGAADGREGSPALEYALRSDVRSAWPWPACKLHKRAPCCLQASNPCRFPGFEARPPCGCGRVLPAADPAPDLCLRAVLCCAALCRSCTTCWHSVRRTRRPSVPCAATATQVGPGSCNCVAAEYRRARS